jgi:hypothetical protein
MTRTRAVAAGLVVLAFAAAYFLWSQSRAADRGEHGDGAGASGNADEVQAPPHCGGEQESLSAAFADASYTVELPSQTAARSSALQGAWDCPGSATLLEFSSGLTLAVDINTIADPSAAWKTLAESSPRIYSVGEINGVAASFIDPDGDPNDDAKGGVTFVIDGIYVSVGGNGRIPLRDLVAAAEQVTISKR